MNYIPKQSITKGGFHLGGGGGGGGGDGISLLLGGNSFKSKAILKKKLSLDNELASAPTSHNLIILIIASLNFM